ncbi:MAG TPA: MG2 domain-containing protein [Pirellulales bacterium]|nr:MG2 domain-containing protein [Pirellulales bacterium]
MRARLAADPTLAESWRQVERQRDLLARVARLEHPPVELHRPAEPAPAAADAVRPSALRIGARSVLSRSERRQSATGNNRGLAWALALAAAVLLAVSVGGYWYEQSGDSVADNFLRLVVSGPAVPRAGAENRYSVTTSSPNGRPVAAKVESALVAPDGKEVWRKKSVADEEGRLQLALPADASLQSGARLEIAAAYGEANERIETSLAVSPDRHVTHLALDKPLYQPGETVFYRSLTLARSGLASDREVAVHFELHDPSGAVVAGSEWQGITLRGVGNGAFQIPEGLPGGAYRLVATSPEGAFPKEEREFAIRQYRLPRLKKELELLRDSYAPGDKVVADFSAVRAEGGPAAGAALTITALVDGQIVYQQPAVAAADGTSQIEFTLPEQISAGAGQLAVAIDDGGTQETIAKTVPINLGKIEVEFFPEGGDLAAGLENRVYFLGRDPLGKPVHLEGRVVDRAGQEVATLETKHEGMGSFRLNPQVGESYTLEISKPAGVTNRPTLPEVAAEHWLAMDAGGGVFDADAPIELKLSATKADRPLVVAAYCRGAEVGQQAVVMDGAEKNVSLALGDEAGGVIRLTVYDYAVQPPRPLAERLVYRRPARQLKVSISDASSGYSPGEKVRLGLTVLDEQDRPARAVLGVAVVDDALLNLADDDSPRMTTHFLLGSEVRDAADLEDLDFYLSGDAEAVESLNLLLGVQGWRRFLEKTFLERTPLSAQPQTAAGGAAAGPSPQPAEESITRLAELGELSAPPALFDNLAKIEPSYRTALTAVRKERTWLLAQVGLVGGLLLWLVVLVFLAGRQLAGVWSWLPVASVATVCLLIALGRFQPATRHALDRAVAFQEFRVEPQPATVRTGVDLANLGSAGLGFGGFGGGGGDLGGLGGGMVQPEALAARGYFWYADGSVQLNTPAAGMNFMLFGDEQADRFGTIPLDAALGGAKRLGDARFVGRARQVVGAPGIVEELQLRRLAAGNALFDGADLAKKRPFVPMPVRQYAHVHRAGPPGVRSDFAETLFWNPLLIADAQGQATLEFELSDAVTTFRVSADAHGEGRLGSGGGEIVSRIPFNLSPKLPLEVNAGDRIELPVAVANDTAAELPVTLELSLGAVVDRRENTTAEGSGFRVQGSAINAGPTTPLRLDGGATRELTVPAGGRRREHFTLDVTGQNGEAVIALRGQAGTLADAVERRLRIVPPGFPVNLSYGGKITGEQEVSVTLPDDWVPGSLEVTLAAYPSSLADIQKGLEGILQEPNGCFEQASSSNYPNVLTLGYLEEHRIADPQVTRRARELLKSGYGKLTGYECTDRGYEWFGGNPGHEALTAYGLLEFRDMARVYDVDRAMLDRTAAWLRSRRDGRGGFLRNDRALDSFGGAPADITDAYIVWALAESGEKDLDAELSHVQKLAADSDDAYLVALAAAGSLAAGRDDDGRPLLKKLAKLQADDGHLTGKNGSITRSGGLSLEIETTALAALAWLRAGDFARPAERAVDWIVSHRQSQGGFGSTQATILALKALIAHAKTHRAAVTGGELIVKRGDDVIGRRQFTAGEHNAIEVAGLAAQLTPGENQLKISLSGDNQMPYGLDVSYRVRRPPSDADCAVRLSTELAAAEVDAGQTVALKAKLENTREEGQPMTIAILGLPAGLEPRKEQLDELKDAGRLDYYELRAREVICYWRSLTPRQTVDLSLDLVAEIPGRYIGPASRAYLYYTAEKKSWTEPLAVTIGPRE